jgi:diguanylate cyclase (GGDEF)-like protein/PAS domain S-box-containing protein
VTRVATPDGATQPANDGSVTESDLQSAFDHAPLGMAITDPAGVVLAANEALVDLLQVSARTFPGTSLFSLTHADDLPAARAACMSLADGTQLRSRVACRFRRGDGAWIDVLVWTATVLDAQGRPDHLVMHVQDVTEHRVLTDALREQALKDALTGLPNRTLLLDRIEHAVSRYERDGDELAIMVLDLDDFKDVNDTLGHAAGDEALRLVAQRLVHHVRPDATVARLGGDEFVVVCEGTDPAQARQIAARLADAVSEPAEVEGRQVTLHASIGVASLRDQPQGAAHVLLAAADAAMYRAKKARRTALGAAVGEPP